MSNTSRTDSQQPQTSNATAKAQPQASDAPAKVQPQPATTAAADASAQVERTNGAPLASAAKHSSAANDYWQILCWNVNGLRAVMKKGFPDFLNAQNADIVCLQEIKVTELEAPKLEIPYPYQYYNSAAKKGYSGTATFSRHKPLRVERPFDGDCPESSLEHPCEGRVLTLEFDDFFLVNVYVPNAQDGLRRLDYRIRTFDRDFRAYLRELGERKAIVVCGDFNVAHQEIDIARPKANTRSPGFTDEERTSFSEHLEDIALLDVFRHQHGDIPHQYTWWSYRGGARERNVGWRIDYFLVSASAQARALQSAILPEVHGSDHCPIRLTWAVTPATSQTLPEE